MVIIKHQCIIIHVHCVEMSSMNMICILNLLCKKWTVMSYLIKPVGWLRIMHDSFMWCLLYQNVSAELVDRLTAIFSFSHRGNITLPKIPESNMALSVLGVFLGLLLEVSTHGPSSVPRSSWRHDGEWRVKVSLVKNETSAGATCLLILVVIKNHTSNFLCL